MTPGGALLGRVRGAYLEDPWGYDPGYVAAVQPLFDLLHDRWWRVRTSGAGHVPVGGGAAAKPWSERHRLGRFGRGGFAEVALRAGIPIVPCGIVGAEEAYPRLANAGALARLARLPAFPITPTFPLLGPLGLVPLPSKWHIAFGTPIAPGELGPEAADDRSAVLGHAERVRDRVQELVLEQLVERAGAFT